jgi:hypothetical protein
MVVRLGGAVTTRPQALRGILLPPLRLCNVD